MDSEQFLQRHSLARRSALVVLLAIGLSATTISCSRMPDGKGRLSDEQAGGEQAGDEQQKPAAEMPSEAEYKQVAQLFGEALVAGEYGAAYQLTSSRLQHRIPTAKFVHACQEAVTQYGQAERLGPVVAELTDGLDGAAASDQYGFPAEIPDDDRLAWLHASLALELDGDEILRCYDCWMLLENDHGKARVGHFAFTPCGE